MIEHHPSILLLNGPNLNLLGKREPDVYGHTTLQDVEEKCKQVGQKHGISIICKQSNHEGQLIDFIHEARETHDAIVINPAAYTHTSVAIRDALIASDLPVFEIHISNIHRREKFRHHSYVSDIAVGVVCGLGVYGYELIVEAAIGYVKTKY